MSWGKVSTALRACVQPLEPSNAADVLTLLNTFVAANADSSRSTNHQDQDADVLDGLVSLLSDPGIEAHPDLALASLKAFKILSRKKVNRLAMNGDGRNGGAIRAVLPFLPAAATSHDLRGKIHEEQAPTLLCTMARLLVEDAFGLLERLGIQVPGCGDAPAPSKVDTRLAAEAAKIIMNACYEEENVDVALTCQGAARLVACLGTADTRARAQDLQASAAGALQSLCFWPEGRAAVCDAGGIPLLVALLTSNSLKVVTRAVGAVHNVSSDAGCIRIIRRNDGIPSLVKLLKSPHPEIAMSAAGALQNLSRDVASRGIIQKRGAVRLLTDLLLNEKEPKNQVAAAGALLNLLGPELAWNGTSGDGTDCKSLKGIIVCCMVVRSIAYGAGSIAAPPFFNVYALATVS